MTLDSYPLLDAFACAVTMYLAFWFIWKLQGRDFIQGMPLAGHALLITILWVFWTFCAVYNATEKSTIILGTIIIIAGVAVLFLAFFTNVFQSFGKSTDLAKMIQKYKGDYANPQIVLELYQYCYNHKLLSPIVRRYNASVGDFSLIYMYLISHCPAVGKGHFIPISTFFFAASLDYVLARKDFLNFEDTLWLKRYFGLIAR